MPALYENKGIRFYYPENWSLVDEEPEQWPRSVTVQSEQTSFWSLHVYPAGQNMGEVIDAVIDTIREVYPDLEILEGHEKIGDVEARGVDICFFFLDLLVEAKIRAIQTPTYTLVWHYQAESKEFTEMEPVFQAMVTSLLQTLVPVSK
jgi:hypothetical protein